MGSKQESFSNNQFDSGSSSHCAMFRLLNKLGLISAEQAKGTAAQHERFPVAHFAAAGCYDEWEAITKLAAELAVPVYRVERANESKLIHLFEQQPLDTISIETWSNFRAMPVKLESGELTICLCNPLDIDLVRRLEFDLQLKVKICMGQERQIMAVITSKLDGRDGLDYQALVQASEPLELKTEKVKTPAVTSAAMESNLVSTDVTAPTVIRLVNKIFSGAVQQGASDVHVMPQQDKVLVKVRIDGVMRTYMEIPSSLKDAVVSRIKVICGMDITEKRLPQDGRLRLKTNHGSKDLRISTVPTIYGEDVVARILSSEMSFDSFESLGMPETVAEQYRQALTSTSKVILVTGPTGSGKTSSLYAALMHKCDGSTHIMTIEDPIEYRLNGISQIQINSKIDMTFDAALRSVLRQDPDVILVGEIRDRETASTAMHVAQTGHLVLSSLHTNSASAAITRLRDLGIEPYLVASSVSAIFAQRLVRKLCTDCAVPLCELDDGEGPIKRAKIRCSELGISMEQVRHPIGCEACSHTGYRGRTGIFSFLQITDAVAQAIREQKSEYEVEQVARNNGFCSLEEAGVAVVGMGLTSITEVERVMGRLPSVEAPKVDYQPDMGEISRAEVVGTQLQKRKILLVDDDENLRCVFSTLLEFQMYDVNQAEDGIDAMNSIYKEMPELIVCDVMMPRLNGVEFLRKLRGNSQTREIPVLMLTAASTPDNELSLIQAGADDFVSKTARSEIILARINRLLNR